MKFDYRQEAARRNVGEVFGFEFVRCFRNAAHDWWALQDAEGNTVFLSATNLRNEAFLLAVEKASGGAQQFNAKGHLLWRVFSSDFQEERREAEVQGLLADFQENTTWKIKYQQPPQQPRYDPRHYAYLYNAEIAGEKINLNALADDVEEDALYLFHSQEQAEEEKPTTEPVWAILPHNGKIVNLNPHKAVPRIYMRDGNYTVDVTDSRFAAVYCRLRDDGVEAEDAADIANTAVNTLPADAFNSSDDDEECNNPEEVDEADDDGYLDSLVDYDENGEAAAAPATP